jgi:alpha-L-rhamnosidase
MNRRDLLIAAGSVVAIAASLKTDSARAQSATMEPAIAGDPVARWADMAESLRPELIETEQLPQRLVRAVADSSAPLLWRMETEAPAGALSSRVLKKGDAFIVDFGGHRTGNLSFVLQTEGREPDAPARLRLTFGEVPSDVAEPLYPYKGMLSSSWLPDEIINVDYLPQHVRLPRRYAFRYVKVEIIDTSSGFGVRFEDFKAHALTSAAALPAPSPARWPEDIRRIDEVSVATLRDCMQTCFEDGPRRDQRLWLGDLRLQAATNYVTFNQNNLVKRCLYLFAAFPRNDGLVAACVYEKPKARYGGIHIVDYAALFNVALLDYVIATGDEDAGRELFPVAQRQLEILSKHINTDGLFVDPGNVWIFIDWAPTLHKAAAIQGILIYAYRQTLKLAERLGLAPRVRDYPSRIKSMTAAARSAFFDVHRGICTSGPDGQVSWASQAWLTIAGVLTRNEASNALVRTMAIPGAVKPLTPYLYHYVAEALLDCGQRAPALELVRHYWGGMVRAGADTFWEAYDPENPLVSPYGDRHINSYCHAWSCGPSYLLRARGLAA